MVHTFGLENFWTKNASWEIVPWTSSSAIAIPCKWTSITFCHYITFNLTHTLSPPLFIPQCRCAPVKSCIEIDSRFIRTKLQLCVSIQIAVLNGWVSILLCPFAFLLSLWAFACHACGSAYYPTLHACIMCNQNYGRWEFFVVRLCFFVMNWLCCVYYGILCKFIDNFDLKSLSCAKIN